MHVKHKWEIVLDIRVLSKSWHAQISRHDVAKMTSNLIIKHRIRTLINFGVRVMPLVIVKCFNVLYFFQLPIGLNKNKNVGVYIHMLAVDIHILIETIFYKHPMPWYYRTDNWPFFRLTFTAWMTLTPVIDSVQ